MLRIQNQQAVRRKGIEEREKRLGVLLITPALVIVLGLVIFPLFYGLNLSLTNRDALSLTYNYIGLQNYFDLFSNPEFWQSFKNGVIFAISTVTLQCIFGMVVALLLVRRFIGRNFCRGIALFPYMVPTIVVASIWRWMYNDTLGILNHILKVTGISPLLKAMGLIRSLDIGWLANPDLAMPAIIVANIWQFFPFALIIFLARLSTIPLILYEAAQIDGASAWQQFTRITLPQMRSAILLTVLMRGIWMFDRFPRIWLYTKGGPLKSTQHLPIYTYIEGFQKFALGRAAAIAIITLVTLLVVALFYFRIFQPETERGETM